MRSSIRVAAVLVAALAMVGCQKKGQNLPLEVARYRVITPDVPDRRSPTAPPFFTPPTNVVRIGDQLWQPGFDRFRLPATSVRQVGSAEGMTFYAPAWDSAPYDRVLVNVPGQPDLYQEFLGVF